MNDFISANIPDNAIWDTAVQGKKQATSVLEAWDLIWGFKRNICKFSLRLDLSSSEDYSHTVGDYLFHSTSKTSGYLVHIFPALFVFTVSLGICSLTLFLRTTPNLDKAEHCPHTFMRAI